MAAMGGRDDLRFSTFVPLVEDLLEGPGARSTPSTVPSSEPAPTPSGGGTGPSSRLPSGFKLRSRLVDLGTVPEIRANLQTILVMETELGRTERIQKVLSLLERLDTVEREAVARYGEETFDTMDLTLSIRVPIILPDDHPTPSLTRSSVGEPEAEAEAEFDCPICFDSVPADQGYALLSCTHRYCQGCFVGYFQNKIRDGEVSKKDLKCPDPSCPAVPEDYELEAVLSPEDYTKYLDFLAMQGVREEQSIVWCPNTECREAIMAEAASDRVDCPACKTAFCRKCQLFPWHDKQTCEEAKAARDVDRSLVIWMEEKGSKVKPCPSCKEGIEKNDGCNHMTCARCKHQWCWLCVGNYEYGHFNSGPCNGLQFAKGDTLEEALALRRPSSSPAAPVAAPTTARVTVAPVRPSHLAHLDRNIPDAEVRAYQALMARQASSSSSSSPSSSSSGPTVRPLIRPVPASLEAPWYVRLRNKFRN